MCATFDDLNWSDESLYYLEYQFWQKKQKILYKLKENHKKLRRCLLCTQVYRLHFSEDKSKETIENMNLRRRLFSG